MTYRVLAVDETIAGVVWVMVRGGLRIGEVLALRRRDVDLPAGTLTVARSLSRREGVRAPKTEAGVRTIPMPSDLSDRLRRHLEASAVAALDGFPLVGARVGALRDGNYRRRRSRIVAAAGLADLGPHDLRHSCATRLVLVDGFGPAESRMLLGHSDARTSIEIYT